MYITFYKNTRQTINFEDLFDNFGTIQAPENTDIAPYKITVWNPTFNTTNQPIPQMKHALNSIAGRVMYMRTEHILNEASLYETFYIPKHSGGMRRIDAPKPELMELLRDIKDIFENDFKFLAHDKAYAYVKQRSTIDALTQHQKNESKWFLKLDMKDFFPNCTKTIILNAMLEVFPFATLMQDETSAELLDMIVDIALLNGGLPQGTPLSPLLTNLIMVPYDYKLYQTLNNFERNHFIYTRYADDLLISCKYDFDKEKVFDKVQEIVRPFQLKPEKTRYGSSAGRNWNLGLMLNKDNQITVGYKNKQRLKAALFNFLQDFTNNNPWSTIDTQVLMGLIAYHREVELDYTNYLINKYNTKFNLNFHNCVKQILNPIH